MNDLYFMVTHYFEDVLDSTLGRSKLLQDFMKRFDKSDARYFNHVVERTYTTDENKYEVMIHFSFYKKKKKE